MLLLFMSILHNFQVYGTSGEERKSRKAAANGLRGGWWGRRTPNAIYGGFFAFQHKKRGCRWVGEKVADLGLHVSTSFSELLQPGALWQMNLKDDSSWEEAGWTSSLLFFMSS